MKFFPNRRTFLGFASSTLAWLGWPGEGEARTFVETKGPGNGGGKGGGKKREADDYVLPPELAPFSLLSLVLGRATDRSMTVSALAKESMEGFIEYGTSPGQYVGRTKPISLPAGAPVEVVLDQLQPDTGYFYRLQYKKSGETRFTARPECRFHTQRSAGKAFTFSIQGDSHPERPQMSEPHLYARTLLLAAQCKPDFHICMGDDFSVERLRTINAETTAQPYLLQRPFLGLIGQSAPVFLLNGNHEQASLFNFNQTDERHEVAVGAQNARNKYYPTPAPDSFYSGNTEPVKSIGPLKDYYAWTWGDALFVILDNYWHSPALVDNGFHERDNGKKGHKDRDWWGISMGDAQYRWFKQTLEQSKAKYKFVFAHHVLGTARGGIEPSELYEWGGKNKRGDFEFKDKRPGWEMPVHDLMVKHGVNIFFQGHDHLFARQERDGIVYQEVPMPCDHGYETYNDDRYLSGTKLPNSGYLQVSVSPEHVKVDYIRSYLPKDETAQKKTGDVAHSYTVSAKNRHA